MVDNSIFREMSQLRPGLLAARVGSNISAWRQEASISKAELASCLGISTELVELVEKGEHSLTADQIVLICERFQVKPSRLLADVL